MGKRVTPYEDERICQLVAKLFSTQEIAQVVDRPESTVYRRCIVMKLTPRGELTAGLRKFLLEGGRVQVEEHPTLGPVWNQAHRSGDVTMYHAYLSGLLAEGILIHDKDQLASPNTYIHLRA